MPAPSPLSPRRHLALALVVAAALASGPRAVAVPAIDAPVVDLAEVLSPGEEAALGAQLVALREATGVQMAALTLATLGGAPIDDFAQEVFTRWGGGSKERNDGALLVLAVKDRQSRLHLGYGLEPVLTDATAAELLVDMRDDLRAERYGDAIEGLVDAVAARLDHLTPQSLIAPAPPSLAQKPLTFFTMLLLAWLAALISELLGAAPATRGRKGKPRLLPVVAAKPRNLVLLVALPALVLIVFSALGGVGFGLGYTFGWYALAGVGALSHEVFIKGPIRSVFYAMALSSLVVALAMHVPDEPLPDGGTAALLALALAFVLFFVCGLLLADGKSGGSSYSSGSSSSSYRSSSSSSSSYTSSSSSSSWSGGGGSSGGGGASSTW